MIVDDEVITEQEEHWVSVSDLMAGLMMVFLLVAIIFMVAVEEEKNKIRDVALLYERLRTQLYEDLQTEFKDDLDNWGAKINPDLSIRFSKNEFLFDRGETDLQPKFKEILSDFFPRYLNILTRDDYKSDITEIRIEGHTSSMWFGRSKDEGYILNMELSQGRTRSTLAYLINLEEIQNQKDWLVSHLTANGLSSSKPVLTLLGAEDEAMSRRVEFRVRTDAESRIAEILKNSLK